MSTQQKVNEERLSKKCLIRRDDEIILDLEELKREARERNDESSAQKLDGIIFKLLCITVPDEL